MFLKDYREVLPHPHRRRRPQPSDIFPKKKTGPKAGWPRDRYTRLQCPRYLCFECHAGYAVAMLPGTGSAQVERLRGAAAVQQLIRQSKSVNP